MGPVEVSARAERHRAKFAKAKARVLANVGTALQKLAQVSDLDPELLELEDVFELHADTIARYGGDIGLRDRGRRSRRDNRC